MGSGPEYGSLGSGGGYSSTNVNTSTPSWAQGYQPNPYTPSESIMRYVNPTPLMDQYWGAVKNRYQGVENYLPRHVGAYPGEASGSGQINPGRQPGNYTHIHTAIKSWAQDQFNRMMDARTNGWWSRRRVMRGDAPIGGWAGLIDPANVGLGMQSEAEAAAAAGGGGGLGGGIGDDGSGGHGIL